MEKPYVQFKCNECGRKGDHFHCKKCGSTNQQQFIHGQIASVMQSMLFE